MLLILPLRVLSLGADLGVALPGVRQHSLLRSVASHHGQPIGGIITLRHGRTLVYKYGVSDAGSHKLGTMPLLFWSMITDAKAMGIHEIDFGRSDIEDIGLATFKDRLGATRSTATVLRFGDSKRLVNGPLARQARRLLACVPDKLFVAAGQALYRHIG